MEIKEIENALMSALELDEVHVLTNDGSHFEVIAIGSIFENLSRVKKQQAIYAPLNHFIENNSIHALSIKTFLPQEWQRERKLLGL